MIPPAHFHVKRFTSQIIHCLWGVIIMCFVRSLMQLGNKSEKKNQIIHLPTTQLQLNLALLDL